jgi:hypothetical protein
MEPTSRPASPEVDGSERRGAEVCRPRQPPGLDRSDGPVGSTGSSLRTNGHGQREIVTPVLDAEVWAAALRLYEKRYSVVVVVGPRRHEDWELDVAAVLRKTDHRPTSL